MTDLAERFMRLLEGYDGAHGTYRSEEKKNGSVKSEIKKTARTLREPVTPELWDQHLAGERPLGIIPIRADDSCKWAAVDIDQYDLDLGAIVKQLAELGVPGVVCRTKSGGAHVFVFLSEPVPADEVMAKMRELAARLGHGDAEVFPKQDHMLLDRGDLGNWLNMPYFGGDSTQRYAVKPDGRGMSMSEFLRLGFASQVDANVFAGLLASKRNPVFADGPPCLEVLTASGFPQGTRNNGLFALGVLCKKMHPDNWPAELEKWNHQYMKPPLSTDEVKVVIKSLNKRDYQYRCKDQPLCSYCDARKCRTRKYGVGPGNESTLIESIQILETTPPLFFATVSVGGVVEVKSEQLLSSREFQRECLIQLRKLVPVYKLDDWLPQVQNAIDKATLIEAPEEVSVTGEFKERLEQFCTDRFAAENRDEILLGKPWLDEDTGRVWFRLQDLQDYLRRQGFIYMTRGQYTTRLREMGGGDGFFNLRGRGVRVWWIPNDKLQRQREEHETPLPGDTPI